MPTSTIAFISSVAGETSAQPPESPKGEVCDDGDDARNDEAPAENGRTIASQERRRWRGCNRGDLADRVVGMIGVAGAASVAVVGVTAIFLLRKLVARPRHSNEASRAPIGCFGRVGSVDCDE